MHCLLCARLLGVRGGQQSFVAINWAYDGNHDVCEQLLEQSICVKDTIHSHHK